MSEEVLTDTVHEYRKILDNHDQRLKDHDMTIKDLLIHKERTMMQQRRHEDKMQELTLSSQLQANINNSVKATLEKIENFIDSQQKTNEETLKYTKIIADVLTTGTTGKKLLGWTASICGSITIIIVFLYSIYRFLPALEAL